MTGKKVNIVLNKEGFEDQYIQVFNSFFHLTDKEIKFLAEAIRKQVNKELFAKEVRDHLSEKFEVSRNVVNIYVSKLAKKNAIIKKGKKYYINPYLRPESATIQIVKHGEDPGKD